jgi:hypothetical protein
MYLTSITFRNNITGQFISPSKPNIEEGCLQIHSVLHSFLLPPSSTNSTDEEFLAKGALGNENITTIPLTSILYSWSNFLSEEKYNNWKNGIIE